MNSKLKMTLKPNLASGSKSQIKNNGSKRQVEKAKNDNSKHQTKKMALIAWNGCKRQTHKVALNAKLKIMALNVKLKKRL